MLPIPLKVYGYVGLMVALIGGYTAFVAHERAVGARDERIVGLTVRGDSLVAVIRADSLRFAKRDTVRLFARIDTGHTVIQRLIDTARVYHTDTVQITVERLVTIDSTLRACKEGVQECAQLASDRARRIQVLDSLVGTLKQSQPGFLARWGGRLAWSGGTILACHLARC